MQQTTVPGCCFVIQQNFQFAFLLPIHSNDSNHAHISHGLLCCFFTRGSQDHLRPHLEIAFPARSAVSLAISSGNAVIARVVNLIWSARTSCRSGKEISPISYFSRLLT